GDGGLGIDVEAVGVQGDAGGDGGRDVVGVLDDDEGGADRRVVGLHAGPRLVDADLEFLVAAGEARRLHAAAGVERRVGARRQDEDVLIPRAVLRVGALVDLRVLVDQRVAGLVQGFDRHGAGDGDLRRGVVAGRLAPGVHQVVVQPEAVVEVGGQVLDDALGPDGPARAQVVPAGGVGEVLGGQIDVRQGAGAEELVPVAGVAAAGVVL